MYCIFKINQVGKYIAYILVYVYEPKSRTLVRFFRMFKIKFRYIFNMFQVMQYVFINFQLPL
jgi:hypothetical protein